MDGSGLETPGIKNAVGRRDSLESAVELPVEVWSLLLLGLGEPISSSAEIEENKPVSQVKAEASPGEFFCG